MLQLAGGTDAEAENLGSLPNEAKPMHSRYRYDRSLWPLTGSVRDFLGVGLLSSRRTETY